MVSHTAHNRRDHGRQLCEGDDHGRRLCEAEAAGPAGAAGASGSRAAEHAAVRDDRREEADTVPFAHCGDTHGRLFILFSANRVIMGAWVPGWSASPGMRAAMGPAPGSPSRTALTWRG